MSFASISYTAASTLSAAQAQIQIASSNIANADTEGYTVKSADMIAVYNGSQHATVNVASITNNVNKYLLKGLMTSLTSFSAATTTANFSESLQNLFGSTIGNDQSGTSLGNAIADLETALSQLSATPESDTLKGLVVDAFDTVVTQLRETSSSLQSLRADADGTLEEAVSEVNASLQNIAELNAEIKLAAARGQPVADLEDRRNMALQAVAANINVHYYTNSDNELIVNTGTGKALVSSFGAHDITYSAAASVAQDTVFTGIMLDGVDISGDINSGNIGALLTMRDKTLTAVQSELDEFAVTLMSNFNASYASGVSLPADSTITGAVAVTGADALALTGTTRIAAVDTNGVVTAFADFDLSTYATVGDLVADINANPDFSASINADGVIEITSVSGDGVVTGDDNAGAGFAAHFGMNQMVFGTSAADIHLDAALLTGAATMKTSTLDMSAGLTIGATGVTHSMAFIDDLVGVFTGASSFTASGTIENKSVTFADYAALIVGHVSTDAQTAETTMAARETAFTTLSNQFSSETGVNTDEETARIAEMQQLYQTAAQLMQVLNEMFSSLLSAVRS